MGPPRKTGKRKSGNKKRCLRYKDKMEKDSYEIKKKKRKMKISRRKMNKIANKRNYPTK